MKKFLVLLMFALLFTSCKGSTPAHVYSGKVWVDCMNVNSSQCNQVKAPALVSEVTSTMSLSTTTTTTYEGGDLSISQQTTAYLQGSILNDTPDTIQGFWFCATVLSIQTGTTISTPTPDVFGGAITLAPGASYTFNGGTRISGGTNPPPILGPITWTLYFFDTTNNPAPFTVGDSGWYPDALVYQSTHTPRAVGVLNFNIIP